MDEMRIIMAKEYNHKNPLYIGKTIIILKNIIILEGIRKENKNYSYYSKRFVQQILFNLTYKKNNQFENRDLYKIKLRNIIIILRQITNKESIIQRSPKKEVCYLPIKQREAMYNEVL